LSSDTVISCCSYTLCVSSHSSCTSLLFLPASLASSFSPLSLHDALPICVAYVDTAHGAFAHHHTAFAQAQGELERVASDGEEAADRKSTRLNSSHVSISYAVFCLKKKKKTLSFLRTIILRIIIQLL